VSAEDGRSGSVCQYREVRRKHPRRPAALEDDAGAPGTLRRTFIQSQSRRLIGFTAERAAGMFSRIFSALSASRRWNLVSGNVFHRRDAESAEKILENIPAA